MKKLLQSFCWLYLLCFATSVSAQVQYKIEYLTATQRYQVTMKPLATYTGNQANTGSAQVTVVVPTGNFTPTALQSQYGAWNLDNAIARHPSENPNFDYVTFYQPALISGTSYTSGVEVPLFSFAATGACVGNINLINNATDPFMPSATTGTNSLNLNVGNQISILGFANNLLANAYQSNYGSSAQCPGAQTCAIQYQLVKTGNTYQVNMIPNVTYTGTGNTTSTQQISIKAPTGLVYTNLTSLTGGATYQQGSRINAPAQATANDYIIFNLANLGTTALTYTDGVSVPLFKFDVPGTCTGDLALMPDTDPFTTNTSYNPKQQITMYGYGQADAPICFVGSGVVPCPAPPAATCQVEYELERLANGKFQVSMIPHVSYTTPNNTTSTQQVTVKAPTGFQYTGLTSLISGATYFQGSRINAPSQATGSDYIIFNLSSLGTTALSYSNNVKIPLFTFDKSGNCPGDSLRLMKDSDPFTSNTSYNPKQQLTVLGYGQADIPICVKGSGAATCQDPAVVSACLIKYQLETVNGCEYRVSMIPDTTWNNTFGITKVAKVTLRVPHNCFQVADLTSLSFGANFSVANIVQAPADNPAYDYICFNMTTVPTVAVPYVKGVPVPLFTFKNSGNCCGNIELMPTTDPFAHGNTLNQNFDQHWTTSGTGPNGVEPCIVGQPQPCVSSQSSNLLGADKTICAGNSVQLNVTGTFSAYNWSPATGLSATNVANPTATPAATTTYYVTATTVGGCAIKDTIVVNVGSGATISTVNATNPTGCANSNGTITVNATSASGVLEYSINNGVTWQVSNVFASLSAGSYLVKTRIQGTNCETVYGSNPVVLTATGAQTITNVASNNPTTCGTNNGQISISVTGTDGPFQYSIDGGTTYRASNTFSGLAAGTYNIKVQNAASTCSVTAPAMVLIAPTAPSLINATATAPTDCGVFDGTISINATGGTAPLQYSIDGINWQYSNTILNVAAGSYMARVRNANNSCMVTASTVTTVTAPVSPTFTNLVATPPTSCSAPNGSIVVSAVGGAGQLEYSIDNNIWQTTSVFNNLPSGTYYVYVRNQDNTCPKPFSGNPVVLNATTAPAILTVVKNNPSNCGLSDGSITITTSPNTGVEYSINGGTTYAASGSFTGLTAGSYNIRVRATASPSCTTSLPTCVITQPVQASISNVSATPASDCSAPDGTIIITANGGEAPLQYSINGTNWQSSNIFTNATPGTYTVRVRNNNGSCVYTHNATITVGQPTAPNVPTAIATTTTCGANTGTITITATGGQAPLEYSIDNINWQTNNVFSNLAAGSYKAYVRNSNNTCSVAAATSVAITQTSGPNFTNIVLTDGSSCGTNNGSIVVTVSGATSPQYSINGGLTYQTSNTFSGLAAGSYDLVVKNGNNTCPSVLPPLTINAPQAPVLLSATSTAPTGCTSNDGTITVLANGTGALEYSVNGTTWQTNNVFANLAAGSYIARVRLSANAACLATATTPIVLVSAATQPVISAVASTNPTSCGGTNGTINITATASAAVQYSIDNIHWQSAGSFAGLAAGSYTVMVRNANGTCAIAYASNPVVLNATGGPAILTTLVVNPTACTAPNGSITIITTASTGPLRFSIDNGVTFQTSNIFTNVAGGTYLIKVSDFNAACQTSGTATLVAPVTPAIPVVTATAVSTCAVANGSVTVTSPLGSGFEYSINNGASWQTNAVFSNLAAAPYSVQARAIGTSCTSTSTPITVLPLASPIFSSVDVTYSATTCTINDGQITINIFNSGNWEYSIDNGLTWQTSNTFSNLIQGTYMPMARSLGAPLACTKSYPGNPIVISSPQAPSITAEAVEQTTTCNGTDGKITVTAYGSNLPLEYQLNNGAWQTSNVFANLAAGTYTIKVRDGLLCTANGTPVVIKGSTAPTALTATVTPTTDCALNNGSVSITSVTGGIAPFEYSLNGITWQTSNQFINVAAGTYNVRVRSVSSTCVFTNTTATTITNPTAPILNNVTATPADCGQANGSITVSGSTGALFSIDGGVNYQTSGNFTNLAPGMYNVVIKNQNGTCSTPYALNPIDLTQGLGANITNITLTNPTDCNVTDGKIVIVANGGVAPLEYSINGGTTYQASATFNAVAAGTYVIAVRGAGASANCPVIFPSVTLKSIPAPNIQTIIAENPASCGAFGKITVLASGGNTPLEYSVDGTTWQISNVFSSLSANTYTVRVRNAGGTCVKTATIPVTLVAPTGVTISNVAKTDPLTCSAANGTITVTASSNTSVQYSIDNIHWQTANTFTGLAAGAYTVYVRKSDGTCATAYASNPVTLNGTGAPVIVSVSKTNITDCNLTNGTISITMASATSQFKYSIDNGATYQLSNYFSDLAAGTYTVKVSDLAGACPAVYPNVVVAPATSATFAAVTATPTTDCSSNNGSIAITPSAAGTLQYSINGGASWTSTNTFTNLAAGSYIIMMRNANGTCAQVYPQNVVVAEPQKPTITSVVDVDPLACGLNTGSITITATGGTGTYQYSINGATWQSANTFTGLAAGAYTVYVRNAGSNCPVQHSLLVNTTPTTAASIISVGVQDPTTCNGNDGKINIVASGNSTLEYSVNGGTSYQASSAFTGLAPGAYNIRIRNIGGSCMITYPTVNILATASPIIVSVVPTATTDCSKADGMITINAASPKPLEYSLNGTTWYASNTIMNVAAGTYTVSVRIVGTTCVVTATTPTTVTQPASSATITTVTKANPTVCGTNNGSITISATGTGLQYSIDGINWQTNGTFNNLPSGSYLVYARGASGLCPAVYGSNPVILSPGTQSPIITSVLKTNASNCSVSNGSLTISASGGSSTYQYSINGGSTWQTSGVYNNLAAGSYDIMVRNADGTCATLFVPVTITSPSAPIILASILTKPVDCAQPTGKITVLASGAAGLQYSIDNGTTWTSNNTFVNLGPGYYFVKVRNADGSCEVSSPANPITSCEFDLALRKKLSVGQDSIVRIGSDVNFDITVFNQGAIVAKDIEVVDYLPAGTILSPLDVSGWTYAPGLVSATGNIDPSKALKVKKILTAPLDPGKNVVTAIKLRIVYGGPNARLVNVAEIAGAKDQAGVIRQDGDSTPDDTKGNDKEKDDVIDDKGITDEDDEDPAPIRLDDYDPQGYVYCDKSGTLLKGGTIQLLTGPVGGQIYFANDANGQPLNGSNGIYQFFTNGVPGTYNITYVNPNGYALSTMVLPQVGSFNPAGTDGTAVDKDGIVNNITVLGSAHLADSLVNKTPAQNPYYLSFTLNANETTIIAHNNIPVSCACVTAIVCLDANGDGLPSQGETGLNGVQVTAYNCVTNAVVGSALTANGGQYKISGLLAGSYKMKFTLPSGYTYANTASGQPFNVNAATGETPCFTLGYGGCEEKAVCVNACPILTVSPNVTICAGSNTTLTVSGGNGTFTWSPAAGLSSTSGASVTATPSVTTTYTVTSVSGTCTSTANITVTVLVPPSNNFTVLATQPTACGTNNGSIVVSATPSAGLEYSIDNGTTWQVSNSFNNLAPAAYIIKIRNAGSVCSTAYISNPVDLTPASAANITNVTVVNSSNCVTPNGAIFINTTGGTSPQYSINGGLTYQSSNVFSNLAAGTYNIRVRNAGGACEVSYPAVTLINNKPVINAVNVVSDCVNNNRSITILASGGQAPLEYSIDNGATWVTSNVFNNLAPGYYNVKVRNFNGTCDVAYGSNPIAMCAFDLALEKKLAPGQTGLVRLGDVIQYQVIVTNQGAINATNIQVVDYIPAGMQVYPSGSNGWTAVGTDMATNTVASLAAGTSVTLNLSMRLVFGSPNTSLKNVAEIKDARDGNGNVITDIDSTPDMVKGNDTEKDGKTNEDGKNGGDEDDADPELITLDNFDPSGYIYCEKTGKVITGGKIKVVSVPTGGEVFFATDASGKTLDGGTGMYQLFTNGVSGIYTFTYEHPNGYPLSTTCTPQPGAFNPKGNDGNAAFDKDGTVNGTIHLGSLITNGYMADKSCAANKYFLSFLLEKDEKVLIATNNIPVSCAVAEGKICTDTNGDGLPQATEPGIAGLKVNIYDCKSTTGAPFATTTTDNDGKYTFEGLTAGQYKIQVIAPNGHQIGGGTFNANGYTACTDIKFGECKAFNACITLCPTINNVLVVQPNCPKNNGVIIIDAVCQGDLQYSIDGGKTYQHFNAFMNLAPGTYTIKVKNDACVSDYAKVIVLECEDGGLIVKGSISGKTFKSCSDNGLKSASKGIANVKVTLTSATGAVLTTTSSATGLYNFANIDAGTYTVTFEKQTGFNFVKQDQGNDDTNDSDADVNGKTNNITVNAGQLIDNVDAGFQDVQGPSISFTHPWLVGKKNEDIITMQCGYEYFFAAKDGIATDNGNGATTVKFTEDPAIVHMDCTDGFIAKMHCGWLATDECGNKTQIWFTFIVKDTIAPVLSGVPANVTVTDASQVPTKATPTAKDKCDSDVAIGYDEAKNGNTITRTWIATDNCGNKSTATQIITIKAVIVDCQIKDVPVALTAPATCGVKDGKAKFAPNNFGFLWPDGIKESTRLDLGVGTYNVTVTDLNGCTAIVPVTIKDNCNGGLAVFKKSLEVIQIDCEKGHTEYCLDFDYIDFVSNYKLTDNGAPYAGKLLPCSELKKHEYIFEGVEGINELTLDYWKVGNKTFSGKFVDINDLLSKMNTWDPTGKWSLDPITQAIHADGDDANQYGEMKITDPYIDQIWIISINKYTIPQGLRLDVGMGNHNFVMKHKKFDYQDTMQFVLACTQPNYVDINVEVGEVKYFELSTTELVGKNCAITATYVEATNPVADITFTKKGPAMRAAQGMYPGFEMAKYSMCDEYGVCDTTIVRVNVRAAPKADDPIVEVDKTIKIYNAFSPNGDDANEVFLIKNIEYYPNSTLSVFNRWGNVIYKTTGYKNDWKGTWDSGALPEGTYFYFLNDGKGNSFSGYLQLER
jgi:large repetitive protein